MSIQILTSSVFDGEMQVLGPPGAKPAQIEPVRAQGGRTMTEQVVERVMQKTIDLEDFLQLAQRDPMKFFDECPIEEVRKHCLDYLKAQCGSKELADWYERVVVDLLKINDSMGIAALSSYLYRVNSPFHDGHEAYVIRALNFLVNLSSIVPTLSDHVLSKQLGGLMKKGQHSPLALYSKIACLKQYLSKLLEKINHENYILDDWDCARRALDIIVVVNDYSFLEQINKLIILSKKRAIYPTPSMRYDSYSNHLATLKSVVVILNDAEKEASQ